MVAKTDPKNNNIAPFDSGDENPGDVFDIRRRLQLKTRFHHDSQDEAADIA